MSLAPVVDTDGVGQDVVALDNTSITFVANGVALSARHLTNGSVALGWQPPLVLGLPSNDRFVQGITFENPPYSMIFGAARSEADVASDLWSSSLTEDGWQVPTPQPGTNSGLDELDPHLTADGSALYFSSNREGFGGWDLYSQQRTGGQWENARNLGEPVNTASDERSPFVTSDGKRLYFARRTAALPKWQIYYSNWNGSSWAIPVALGGPVNSPDTNQLQATLTPDASRMYVLSDRGGPVGNYEIFMAVRRTTDSDGDGIRDYDPAKPGGGGDNCWNVANPDQADINHNGIGDVCEVPSGCSAVPIGRPEPPTALVFATATLVLSQLLRWRSRRQRPA